MGTAGLSAGGNNGKTDRKCCSARVLLHEAVVFPLSAKRTFVIRTLTSHKVRQFQVAQRKPEL